MSQTRVETELYFGATETVLADKLERGITYSILWNKELLDSKKSGGEGRGVGGVDTENKKILIKTI